MHIQPGYGRIFMGRFKHGDDLLGSLTDLCDKENIRLGIFSVIGAVTQAKLGYYDQANKKYAGCVELDSKLEITSCTGNVSLKDGEIFVHAHITLAGFDGKAFGGHLMPSTLIFAAEFCIQEFVGGELRRGGDEETGLPLWNK